MKPEPKYHNPKTGKSQKLFDKLIPVYNVKYTSPDHEWKGETVNMVLEANDEQEAIDNAMKNQEFISYIDMTNFDKKYFSVYKSVGNYVIGKVNHFKGNLTL